MLLINRQCFSDNIIADNNFTEGLWDVTINHKNLHDTGLFLLDSKDQVWVAETDLHRWNLRIPNTTAKHYQETNYYPLTALDVRYKIDQSLQAITLEAPANAFESNFKRINRTTVTPTPSNLGGFINYDAILLYDNNTNNRLDVFTELGLFNQRGVGTTTLLGQNLGDDNKLLRLDSTWTLDMPERLTTIKLGDTISQASSWGSAVRFGGIQWATNFATQPHLLTFPQTNFAGEALLPSTVDIYVNNILRSQEQVPAGPFTITDIPVITGHGEMRVVVRDLLGREQILLHPYYTSAQMLATGLSAYAYQAGFIREDYTLKDFHYGTAFTAGTYRYGFSDRFTGELHGELLEKKHSLGLGASLLWPEIGTVNLALAASRDNDDNIGSLFAFGFQRQARYLNFSAHTQWTNPNFTQLGMEEDIKSPKELSYASIGLSLERYGAINLGYVKQDKRDSNDTETLNLYYSLNLGKLGAISLSYLHSFNTAQDNILGFTFTSALGERTSGFAHATNTDNEQLFTLGLHQSPPHDSGLDYRLAVDTGEQDRLQGSVTLQNTIGQYSLEAANLNQQNSLRGNVRGGIAFIGQQPHLARYIADSFALIHVPNTPNVHVYADNQSVGTTDADGELLVTKLRPYQLNKIRIDALDLPLSAQVNILELNAVPYFRSGYTLKFPVKYSQSAMLNLATADGTPLPAGAVVRIIGYNEEFYVAFNGEVYITNLQKQNQLQATWGSQTCKFTVQFPETQDPLPHLGTVTCR